MRLAVCLAFAMALAGCDDRPEQWDAYLYNESEDGSVTEYTIRGFKTFELCQSAAQSHLLLHGKGPVQDYECGYKCGKSERYGGLDVCEETRR